jgi:hypothetical protein
MEQSAVGGWAPISARFDLRLLFFEVIGLGVESSLGESFLYLLSQRSGDGFYSPWRPVPSIILSF